ncbi:hypothetical protein [Parabacteroides faecis]|uniref:hypothetical protein n=1 Tax=Parabacteroides faecis TaxID=1217282 RepID=UPI0035214B92
MVQLVVIIEDSKHLLARESNRFAQGSRVQLVHKEEKKFVRLVSVKSHSEISPVIRNLIGVASGLSK